MLVPVFVLLSILAGVRAGGTRVAPDGGRALPDEAPVDIFILAGQSNMDVAPNAAATPLPRNDRVLEFTWANELVIADQVTSVRVPPKNRLWRTPAVEFANAYADAHPTRRVLLVPCAVGATGFTPTTWPDMVTHWNLYVRRYGGNVTSEPIAAASDAVWLANGVLFRSTVRRAEAARNALAQGGAHGEYRGVLWIQGEMDALNGVSTASYLAALTDFIFALRASLGTPDMPFVQGGWGSAGQYRGISDTWTTIDAARRAAAATLPFVGYVDTSDFRDEDTTTDHLHFSASGMTRVASRMVAFFNASEYAVVPSASPTSVPTSTPTPTAAPTSMPTPTAAPTAAPGPSTLQTSPAPSSMLDATAVWSATATLTSEVVERNASSAPAVPTLGGVPPPCSCPWPAAAAVAMSAAASALVAAVVSAAATTCWHRRALSGRSLVLALPRARTTPAKATPSTHDDEETMPLHAVPPKPGDAAQDSVT